MLHHQSQDFNYPNVLGLFRFCQLTFFRKILYFGVIETDAYIYGFICLLYFIYLKKIFFHSPDTLP